MLCFERRREKRTAHERSDAVNARGTTQVIADSAREPRKRRLDARRLLCRGPAPNAAMSLWSLLKVCLLSCNAVAILDKRRFLQPTEERFEGAAAARGTSSEPRGPAAGARRRRGGAAAPPWGRGAARRARLVAPMLGVRKIECAWIASVRKIAGREVVHQALNFLNAAQYLRPVLIPLNFVCIFVEVLFGS